MSHFYLTGQCGGGTAVDGQTDQSSQQTVSCVLSSGLSLLYTPIDSYFNQVSIILYTLLIHISTKCLLSYILCYIPQLILALTVYGCGLDSSTHTHIDRKWWGNECEINLHLPSSFSSSFLPSLPTSLPHSRQPPLTEPGWRNLLQHLLSLRTRVFTCLDQPSCYKVTTDTVILTACSRGCLGVHRRPP